jgi:hypothetical protein
MGHRRSKGIEPVYLPAKVSSRAIHTVVQVGVLVIHPALGNRALELSRVEDGHETVRRVESTSNRLLLEHDILFNQCVAPTLCPDRMAPLALATHRNGKVFIPDNVWLIFRYELVKVATEEDGAREFFHGKDEPQAQHARLGRNVEVGRE